MPIDTRLARRIATVKPSSTLAITSKAKKLRSEGKDIVSFAAGEPDFDTPEPIKQGAVDAIRKGFTKYTPTTGTPELKKIISEKFKRDNALEYGVQQIAVSCGAKHSIFNALFVLLDKGDEAVMASPYWVSYPEMVRLCEGTPRIIETSRKNDFKITPGELKKNIGPKTKLLMLNTPSNPAGSVYTRDELLALAEICVAHKILVISDEIYEKIIFDNLPHVSIASLNKDIYGLAVTVNGVSKSFSMTGWRIGYLGGPADIVEAIGKFQDHSTSNPASISQKAAEAALGMAGSFSATMREEFQKRRDFIVARLETIEKINCIVPKGAFYVFCDISKTGLGSVEFASRLLDEAGVAVIPGESFGKDEYIRISFATGMPQVTKGLDRLKDFCDAL